MKIEPTMFHKSIPFSVAFSLFILNFSFIAFLNAQATVSDVAGCLKYRMIGPHRGGRTVGASGAVQQPNVFYIGVNNGGVWKTNDFGRTWNPIFDGQSTGSVGDIAVAPSNPNTIYVASGEGIQRPDLSVGDGVYKSIDAGKTWTNTGINDGQQIGGIAIDPTNENRVFAAVLGHPYGANTERGVFRTLNGGKTWQKVFYIDENTGAVEVVVDPKNPQIIYADMWAGRLAPWENGMWNGATSGLFKSVDGGNTWKKLIGVEPLAISHEPLPNKQEKLKAQGSLLIAGLSRIGFCISPSNPNRVYATVEADEKDGGIYRSDDGGETWQKLSGDARYYGRGTDFAEIKVDPKNPDIVYSANVCVWKSMDGGKNWTAIRGAPGGDDYHRIWINPNNTDIILIACDQGAIVTVNGGETFSSWFNQPTAQFYHVSTDNAFPYNVYGGQQESGSVGIASRGNDGQITFHEWHPVNVEEYGYVAPDPLDPNIIYGGKITKYDKRTGQVQNIAPESVRSGKYRFLRTAPVLFSPIDPKTLFFAGNVLFKTKNGGNSWDIISPDLTRETWNVPDNIGVYGKDTLNAAIKKMPRRGVIYTVAPSPLDSNIIWAGTDDGLIHVTNDGGKNWANVTLGGSILTDWAKISLIEASHFDKNTAYAAINKIRLDDQKPYILKTSDGGKTWKLITNGLANDPINCIREDPKTRGLLFAGSERFIYVSTDDGGHWQSLRLNMPATSIRDLVIKDDDLVIGTHGRSFWILDNISPLRSFEQLALSNENTNKNSSKLMAQSPQLFQPQTATRIRWNTWPDTPLPQEEPAGENPPDGAIIDYFLKEDAKSEVTLEILDKAGKSICKFSSNDKPYPIPAVNIPLYWIRPQQILSNKAGAHRFLWDLHYQALDVPPAYPISATFKNTAPDPTSPWVLPDAYVVKLSVNGETFTKNLTVKMDPRVTTSQEDLKLQHDLSLMCYLHRKELANIKNSIKVFKEKLDTGTSKLSTQKADNLKMQFSQFEKNPAENGKSLNKLDAELATVYNIIHDTDMPPTSQAISSANELSTSFESLLKNWEVLKNEGNKSEK